MNSLEQHSVDRKAAPDNDSSTDKNKNNKHPGERNTL